LSADARRESIKFGVANPRTIADECWCAAESRDDSSESRANGRATHLASFLLEEIQSHGCINNHRHIAS
jgi:hypothetical protein